MQLFYGHKSDNDNLILDKEESHHCQNVLRKKAGDHVEVVDGRGGYYTGTISETGRQVKIKITAAETRLPARKHHIHLAVAPTKNMDRMEWMVEKATEIGVDGIHFLQCENSERRVLRMDRLEKKALSAMKQSGQAVLPVLSPLQPFDSFLDGVTEKGRFIAHLSDKVASASLRSLPFNQDTVVLIGPEGDFSPKELDMALDRGWVPVALGDTRLRTETACIVACTILNI